MVLAFKKEFVPKILNGTKIHTIREDKRKRWKVNSIINFVDEKNKEFEIGNCLFIQDIQMSIDRSIHSHSEEFKEYIIMIIIGSKILRAGEETIQFILNDGFGSYQEFHDWFYPIIMKSKNNSFHGKLIHWTNKIYKY